MRLNNGTYLRQILIAGLALGGVAAAVPASAKDYLVTALHSNKLVFIDIAARKVDKVYPLPNSRPGNTPGTLVVSPDGKTVYILHNHWETVSGIDVDSGKEVFRANLSVPDIRGKSTFAFDVSPDGKEVAIYIDPVKMLKGEYQVQDTYIAIYDAAAGIGAKPLRSFPAPRRTTLLAYSTDGNRLYAMSWDAVIMDPKTGTVVGKHLIRNWGRRNLGEPDALAVWPLWDATKILSFPYVVARTDRKPDAPDAMKSGIYTLDLATDKVAYKEFENTSVVLFSSTVNPVRRDEVYTVYSTLSRIDIRKGKLLKRVDLEQTFYNVNVSRDGKELYIGGAGPMVAFYDATTLKHLQTIRMPDDSDQATASMRYFSH
ncbi:MAG: quinohemoprotein amine dehydrogenase subunit beta [Rhodocyclaceae bacterium]|nr:MAG: quinohemoprotein amine dehydrogenase subunit beta [Rhodocyclaceae bacterium]